MQSVRLSISLQNSCVAVFRQPAALRCKNGCIFVLYWLVFASYALTPGIFLTCKTFFSTGVSTASKNRKQNQNECRTLYQALATIAKHVKTQYQSL
jgi:hypothetical protein